MPSKRKKNKRRMRRVQAQRRALEEQHAANPPVKASPGIAVSAPPSAATKKVPKSAAPHLENTPQAVPITVPVVETPKVEPKLVVKEPVAKPVEASVEEPVIELLEQTPAEVEVESHVEAEAQSRVAEEAPVEWTPPVESSADVAAVALEAEATVSTTEPVNEVKPPDEAPVGDPAETEVKQTQTAETVLTKTEVEQTHGVCEPETEGEAEISAEDVTDGKVEVETVTEDMFIPEPVKETTEEPTVEGPSSDQVSAGAEPAAGEIETNVGSEVVTEIPKPEKVTESFSPAAPTQEGADEVVVEVLVEEDPAAVHAEPVTAAEEAPVQSAEIPEVTEMIPAAPVEEAEGLVIEAKEGAADSLLDADVVSGSVFAAEDAVTASAVMQQGTVATSENLNILIESVDETPADPEPAAVAPTEDVAHIDGSEQTCLNVSSDGLKSEVCETSCHMQLPVESVQLGSAEISVEATVNGHIVPEVPIEG